MRTPLSEAEAAIARLDATRRRLLAERLSLLEKIEVIDGALRQLDERLQRYRRAGGG